MLVEMTVGIKIGIVPTAHLELTAGFCQRRINAS
jgi:hypothetical protein